MALIDFQTALGRMLREHNRDDYVRGINLDEHESRYFESLRDTPEFRFYAGVQRSWCIARATKAAHLTLSLLPPEERGRLLDEWVDSGSGAQSFFFVEAESFLDFIGGYLSDRPREFTVCQFERATLRASNGANVFVPLDPAALKRPDCCLRRGSYAAVVNLAEVFSDGVIVMFSPGLPQLWHEPSTEEMDVWQALASPSSVSTLLASGHSLETLETLLSCGAIATD